MCYVADYLCEALKQAELCRSMGFVVFIEHHSSKWFVFYSQPPKFDNSTI